MVDANNNYESEVGSYGDRVASPSSTGECANDRWESVAAALLRERAEGRGSHFVSVVRPGGFFQESPVIEDMQGTTK